MDIGEKLVKVEALKELHDYNEATYSTKETVDKIKEGIDSFYARVDGLANMNRWWRPDDVVFNNRTESQRKRLLLIKDIQIKAYRQNEKYSIYDVHINSDSSLYFALKRVDIKGKEETKGFTLSPSEEVITYTENNKYYTINIVYATESASAGTATYETEFIELSNISVIGSDYIPSEKNVDSRIFQKFIVPENVKSLTIKTIYNYDKSVSHYTNDYYAKYQIVYDDETTTELSSYSNKGVLSGIRCDEVGGCKIYINTTVLGYYGLQMESLNAEVNLLKGQICEASKNKESENKSFLANTNKWWRSNDVTFISRTEDQLAILSAIKDIKISSYRHGEKYSIYNVKRKSDGDLYFALRRITAEGKEETKGITLKSSDTVLDYSEIGKYYSMYVSYCTADINVGTAVNENEEIELSNITSEDSPYISSEKNVDSRIFQKVVIPDNVRTLTIETIYNYSKKSSGYTNDYYAKYKVTYNDDTVKTYYSKNDTGVVSGVRCDEVGDCKIYVNATVLGYYGLQMETFNADINLINAQIYCPSTGGGGGDSNFLVNTNRWWQLNDAVFNNRTSEQLSILSAIKDIKISTYRYNEKYSIYNVYSKSDGSLYFALKRVGFGNKEETIGITLAASQTIATYTADNKYYSINVVYTTAGLAVGRAVSESEFLELSNVSVLENPYIPTEKNVDSRIFQKIIVGDNVKSLTVKTIYNYSKSSSHYTNDYYAKYQIVYTDGKSVEYYSANNTGVVSGIRCDEIGGCKVYINATVLGYYGLQMESLNAEVNLMSAQISQTQSGGSAESNIKNNLTTDGFASLPNCTIYKDGTASNQSYGEKNILYSFNMSSFKRLHVYFEFMWTKPISEMGDGTTVTLLTVNDRIFRGILKPSVASNNKGRISQNAYIGSNNAYAGSNSAFFNNLYYESLSGENSFWVRFKGDATSTANKDIVMTLDKESFVVKHKDTAEQICNISYSPDDDIVSLINKISAIESLECGYVTTAGRTCGELLCNFGSVPLIQSFEKSTKETYLDAPRIYIPFAQDKKWHNIELILDLEKSVSYFSYDGLTVKNAVVPDKITNWNINIGDKLALSAPPIQCRNLEINIDNLGSAEIVESYAPPYDKKYQLISEHNPRLLIYEGHGVDVKDETSSEGMSDDMAASTDRLYALFDKLDESGYKPVTWQEIIDWKNNRKPLPKRCYNLMFDDYRFENYVNYQKRKPFAKHNVKPGLAIITDSKSLESTMNIDGKEYTVAKIVDIVMKSGWYPVSHTKDHRLVFDDTPSRLHDLFKADELSCDNLGIYSDVIVYPQGQFGIQAMSPLEDSAFKVGVNIVEDRYNCLATNRFNLTRVEVGARDTLDDVYKPIV